MKNKKESITFDVYERESLCKGFLDSSNIKVPLNKKTEKHSIEICKSYKAAGCTENPKLIFMGTIPSLKGQDTGFYYMAKGNCFWELLENVISKKSNKKRAINYKSEYDTYHSKKSNNDIKMDCIRNINSQLKKDNIALLDTIKVCYRINGLDSGILYRKLQNSKDINQLIKNRTKIIFTSKEAFNNFRTIVGKDNIINYKYDIVVSPSKRVIGNNLKKKREIMKKWEDKV